MADALDLGSSVAIRVGSSPTSPTNFLKPLKGGFIFGEKSWTLALLTNGY